MMSSFHEDSAIGGENLNQSNTRIMSPIFMNKSAFGSPRIEELSGLTKGHSADVSVDRSAIELFDDSIAVTPSSEEPEVVVIESQSDAPTATSEVDEEEESLRLALELQRQEEEALIQMQLDNLRAVVCAGGLSGDDISSMQMMMSDLQHQLQMIRASANQFSNQQYHQQEEDDRSFVSSTNGDDAAENAEEDQEDDEDGEEEEEGEEQWDYDQLIQLGQRLGDVKTERWRMRSHAVISTLPTISFGEWREMQKQNSQKRKTSREAEVINLAEDSAILDLLNDSAAEEEEAEVVVERSPEKTPCHKTKKAKLSHEKCGVCSSSSPSTATAATADAVETEEEEERCAVCMDPYVSEDMLRVLPCQHFFHSHCAQGWLSDHNSCPMCKTKITQSP